MPIPVFRDPATGTPLDARAYEVRQIRDVLPSYQRFRFSVELFEMHVKMNPQSVALEWWSSEIDDKPEAWTFQEVNDAAEGVLRGTLLPHFKKPEVQGTGVEGAKVVALFLPRGYSLIVAMLAAAKARAATTVLDESYPLERVKFITEDTNASILVTTRSLLSDETQVKCPVLYVEDSLGKLPLLPNGSTETVEGSEENVGLIIYTSGSTGKPKGVLLESRSFTNYCILEHALTMVKPGDRVLQTQTLSFIAGYHECWRALGSGATLVMVHKSIVLLGPELLEWIADAGITVFKAVPSLLRTITGTESHLSQEHAGALRLLHVGGEAVSDDLVEFFGGDGRVFLDTYGPSEVCSNCTVGLCVPGKPVTIGRPYPTYTVVLLDEDGNEAEEGEICVGGVGVARGYLNRPEETAKAFVEHPKFGRLYHTGDVGRRLTDGELVYAGRKDFQVKINGYRVELQEVEFHVNRHPAVALTACAKQDTDLVAFVECHEGKIVTGGQIRAFLKESGCPTFMVPTKIQQINKLPRLTNGKIDRKQLPHYGFVRQESSRKRVLTPGSNRNLAAMKALNETDATVLQVVAMVLKLDKACVTPEDDFFELGGSSLTAAVLASTLRNQHVAMFASIGVMDVFRNPRLKDLAAQFRTCGLGGSSSRMIRRSMRGSMRGNMRSSYGKSGWQNLVEGEEVKCAEEDTSAEKEPTDGAFALPHQHNITHVVQSLFGLVLLLTDGLLSFCLFLALESPATTFTPQGISALNHLPSLTFRTTAVFAAIFTLWQLLTLAFWSIVLIAVKWTLIGRYRPGVHPIWGAFFLRHWVVERVCQKVNWGYLSGTPLAAMLMRALGAKIGKCVHMEVPKNFPHHAWDLITVEDGASVNDFAMLAALQYTDKGLEFDHVVVKAGATVEVRAIVCRKTVLGENARLTTLSCLQPGTRAAPGTVWSGSTAQCVNKPERGAHTAATPITAKQQIAAFLVGTLQVLVMLGYVFLQSLAIIPTLSALAYAFGVKSEATTIALATIVNVCADIVIPLVLLRLTFRLKFDGTYGRWSLAYVHLWFQRFLFEGRSSLLDGAQMLLNNTEFLTIWGRLCGADFGMWVEVSRIYGTPALMSIGRHCFLANYTHMGCPSIGNHQFTYAKSVIKSHSFLGNRAVVPCGVTVPEKSLVGVLSVPTPSTTNMPEKIYLGNPAMAIQTNKGKLTDAVDESALLPSIPTVMHRLSWDLGLLTYVVALLGLYSWITFEGFHLATHVYRMHGRSGGVNGLLATLVLVGMTLTASLGVVSIAGFTSRFILIDGMWPGNAVPSMSSVTFRWHLYTKLWTVLVNPLFLYYFDGTYWCKWMYSMWTNARFGRRTFIASCTTLREIDLVKVGSDCIIDRNTVLRTHTQEHMELKLGQVWLEDGCTVEVGSTVMHTSLLHKAVHILPNSLVMKSEELPAEMTYVGVPVRCIRSRV